MPEFEPGLTDIEGFSHLFVIWEFDRSGDFELIGRPPFDDRPHGVFATRSPRRPNPIGLTVVALLRRENGSCTCAASICSTGRPSSISSHTCRVFPRSYCVEDGWRKLSHVRSDIGTRQYPRVRGKLRYSGFALRASHCFPPRGFYGRIRERAIKVGRRTQSLHNRDQGWRKCVDRPVAGAGCATRSFRCDPGGRIGHRVAGQGVVSIRSRAKHCPPRISGACCCR